jgi:hypothetical protein
MGGPILIKAREEQCIGAGPCSDPRPMTYEEMLKYYTESEVEEMSKKIAPLEKGQLIEILAEVTGKTKAVHHAADICHVSATVVYGWIKDYGIEFDDSGMVVREPGEVPEPEEEMEEVLKAVGDGSSEYEKNLQVAANLVVQIASTDSEQSKIQEGHADTITITGKETTEITRKLGYAEHDIGNAIIIYDFRADLVKIVTPSNNEMTPEVARAVAEDILDIFGHE